MPDARPDSLCPPATRVAAYRAPAAGGLLGLAPGRGIGRRAAAAPAASQQIL
jgi:hypothetical protein